MSLARLPALIKYLLLGVCLVMQGRGAASASEILGPDVTLTNNNIIVSTGLKLNDKELMDIKNGVSKEIIFYIDLFRVWQAWPDEFVLGRVFTQTLKCDLVKKEYIAISFDEATLVEKRFKSCEPLIAWALSVPELRLTNTAELDPDMYFIRVTVDSRLRRLPPVIGYLFFFVKEKEFSIYKDSPVFQVKQ